MLSHPFAPRVLAGLMLSHFAAHRLKHIEASHPTESGIFHYAADSHHADWLRPMNGTNSPIVRWSAPPPTRPPGTRILCRGPEPTCSFCGGAHSPCPSTAVEMDLPRSPIGSAPPADDPAANRSGLSLRGVPSIIQNSSLDPSSLFAYATYASVAEVLRRTEDQAHCSCRPCMPARMPARKPDARLGLDRSGNTQQRSAKCRDEWHHAAASPLVAPRAVKGFSALVTCGSHSDCLVGEMPPSFCDDARHCVSCARWDLNDPTAAIDGKRAPACDAKRPLAGGWHADGGNRRDGRSENPQFQIFPPPRAMTLCAACHINTSSIAASMGVCPSLAHASPGRPFHVAEVDCTERYAQLVRCAERTWLFSRIEHFDERERGSEPSPHTQLIARELLPLPAAPTMQASSPPAFTHARVAMGDDKPLKLAANAALSCTDDGRLLLYGGGEGGSGTAWLVGEPPAADGGRSAAGGDGFRWSLPMVGWSGSKSQTRCVEERPHLPNVCEYDGKLSVLRYRGRFLAFARSNLHAHGGRHVQVSSSLSGRSGWSPFEQLRFDGYATAPSNNLYYASVRAVPTGQPSCEHVLLGLLPGAVDGRGGVYASMSADGVRWGALRRILTSEVHASWRTSDHPVDGSLTATDANNGQLSVVIEHYVSVPHRRNTASDPSAQPTDERAQAWCDARRPPLYCEYTLAWAVTRHNASHITVRLGGLAPWLVSCPLQSNPPSPTSTSVDCEGSEHPRASLPLREGLGNTTATAALRAPTSKPIKVAVLVSSGPIEMQSTTLARKLTSLAHFLLRPLRAVADVSAFVCVDPTQPSWQTALMRNLLAPSHIWHVAPCAWEALSDVERQCCENGQQPICDQPELATGEATSALVQFFRLAACFQHVLRSVDGAGAHDFYVRARPDLHWVGPFDVSALRAPEAPRRLGIRYRSTVGLSGLSLGQFQMAWYKVGPHACGEARWQTDHACFTLDDQFALVPAQLAWPYFDFARQRLSPAFLALRRQRSPLVAECSCWRCVEGRLTEYLLVQRLPLTILSLPATVVYDDHDAPPMLLPELTGTGAKTGAGAVGGPHTTAWSPSTRVHCALRNGTWGVAAWLLDVGLLDASAAPRLALQISMANSMQGLWRDEQAWQGLLQLLRQEGASSSAHKAGFRRTARAALKRYAERFLKRGPMHRRCNSPMGAAHVKCGETGDLMAQTSNSLVVDVESSSQREQHRSRDAEVRMRQAAPSGATVAPAVSFILQYYRHPRQLGLICERLRDPRIEVLVHADSHRESDEAAFSLATRTCAAIILPSENLHEIRGYNLAARHARAELLVFSQDDRIPPPGGEWLERVLAIFSMGVFAQLGALGLHRGGVRLWLQPTSHATRPRMVGSCGDAADDVSGHKWDALPSERMSTPIRFVAFMNIGPIVMRRRAFEHLSGFNTSYSLPGQLGIGFDHELIGRLWQAGWQAAVLCPSRATVFRNGCGGKGSAANLSARNTQMERNRVLYHHQFAAHADRIEHLVANAQQSLEANQSLLTQLHGTVRGCIDCEAGGDELQALKHRALGFEDASSCETANPARITYEP